MLIVFAVFSMLISNFMSNTSASNLIIPLVTSFSMFAPETGAIIVAYACSLAMSLPISTPPNAIAFATREVETRDLVKYGTMMSAMGMVLILIAIMVFRQIF
jgi:sodium-dependent dicarboxylate transporter 2/3/5